MPTLGPDDPVLRSSAVAARERITSRRVNGSDGALNLDASESRADPDVSFSGRGEKLEINLGVGRDFFSTAGTDGFDGQYIHPGATAMAATMGDRLVSGRGRRRPWSATWAGHTMIGGPGRDILSSATSTAIRTIASNVTPDRLACGGGADKAYVDPSDRARGCESIHVRKPDRF